MTLIFCLGRLVNTWLLGVVGSGWRPLEGKYWLVVEDFESVPLSSAVSQPRSAIPGVSPSGASGALTGGRPSTPQAHLPFPRLHLPFPSPCHLPLPSLCSRNLSSSFRFLFSWLWSHTFMFSAMLMGSQNRRIARGLFMLLIQDILCFLFFFCHFAIFLGRSHSIWRFPG